MTLRSAALGIVDYSKYERYDAMWWRHWRLKMQGMRDLDSQRILLAAYQFNLALVSSSKIGSDGFTKSQDTAKALFEDYRGSLRPWLGRDAASRGDIASQDFKDEWKALTGIDLDDEEMKAQWEDMLLSRYESVVEGHRTNAEQSVAAQQAMLQRVEAIRKKRQRQNRGIR
jgi:hypothetical protein